MRRSIILVAFSLLLAGCSESNIQKAQEIAAMVKKNCQIAVSVADVVAALSAPNPALTGVVAVANAICSQAERTENGVLEYRGIVPGFSHIIPAVVELAQVEQPEPPPLPQPAPPMAPEEAQPEPLPVPLPEEEEVDDCVAVINGVCIRKEGEK